MVVVGGGAAGMVATNKVKLVRTVPQLWVQI